MISGKVCRESANAAVDTAQSDERRHKIGRGKVCATTCSMRVWLGENGYSA